MQKVTKCLGAAFMLASLCVSCSGLTDSKGDEIRQVSYGYEFVSIRGGVITGTDTTTKDDPSHNQTFFKGRMVKLDDFSIGKYEVTYELWYKVLKDAEKHGYVFANKGRAGTLAALDKNNKGTYVAESRVGAAPDEKTKTHPVTQISWCDMIVWCNAYSELNGKKPVYCLNGQPVKDSSKVDECLKAEVQRKNGGYRLPTSTEWEWAARGGDPKADVWGNGYNFPGTKNSAELLQYACFGDKKNGSTQPVGLLKPNALGLYDMAGNVAECCVDVYASLIRVDAGETEVNPDHPKSALRDETDPSKFDEFKRNSSFKCTRGGSWKHTEKDCRVGTRGLTVAKSSNNAVGFRLVLSN